MATVPSPAPTITLSEFGTNKMEIIPRLNLSCKKKKKKNKKKRNKNN